MPKKFMWTNLSLGVIPKKISKKIFLLLTAVFLIGGFFVVKMALADPIFSVSIDPIAVDIGQTKDIAFTVTSADANNLKTIAVSVQGTGFSNPTSVVCPTGWSKIPAMPPILNGYVCDDPTGTGIGLPAPVVTLNGLVAPSSPGMQNFSVSAINTDSEPKTENINVPIEVKNLAATIGITPITTNVSQTRDYTFTVTNTTGDYVDNITGISGTLGGLTINNCSATGWSYTPAGNSFTLSGGTLTPGAAVEITVNATAPASAGAQTVSATITGALGGTRAASNTGTITVQTPANLSAGAISSDKDFISNVSGSYNTATISVQVTNGGQATANTLVKSLVIIPPPIL